MTYFTYRDFQNMAAALPYMFEPQADLLSDYDDESEDSSNEGPEASDEASSEVERYDYESFFSLVAAVGAC